MRFFASKAFLGFLLISLSFAPNLAKADTLTISPGSGFYAVGKTFPVNVLVSSAQSVNAVSGMVSFPADKLQVVSVSKTSSVITLWVADPTFSNTSGTVSFEGVVPNPGFQGSAGRVVTINFKVIGEGAADVTWSTASVLANDGNGTNILRNKNSATFTLGKAALPVPEPTTPVVETPLVTTSGGIAITSPTFPSQKTWYALNGGKFTWKLNNDISAIRLLSNNSPATTPTVVYDPPITERSITNLEDGVWYLHVQGKTKSGWGTVSHYQFRIDTTPPESFVIKLLATDDQTDPKPTLSFTASDSTSGIDHYTVQIDGGAVVVWRDDGSGSYTVPALGPGRHSIIAKVYDAAGNSTPASLDFTILPIAAPKISFYTEDVKADATFVVKGSALPHSHVEIHLLKKNVLEGADASMFRKQSFTTDDGGEFSAALDTGGLSSGIYNFTAKTIDMRGAESDPTVEKTVLVNASWLQSAGSSLLKALVVAVPIFALLYLLLVLCLHAFRKVRSGRRVMSGSGFSTSANLIEHTFLLLKEDTEDVIKHLEHSKTKHELTVAERKLVDRLKTSLHDAEIIIRGELRKIEK